MNKILTALENLDYNLFKIVNDMHSPFWDDVMWWVSNKFIWIPLYLLILFLFYRVYGWKGAGYALILAITTIGIVDVTASYGIKNTVMRYRPSHNEEFKHILHYVNDYRGGKYGFVSGHAANSFAITIFASRLLRKKHGYMTAILLIWALLICYSRMYLGVHYPADLIGGGLLGGLIAYLSSWVFLKYIAPKLKK